MTLAKVLLVDDEPLLLEALERTLDEQFDVRTATGGERGLDCLRAEPDIAVVVSDMRMPGMDGAAFLARVPELVPMTARILLTGQADLRDASRAVNGGGLFRFILKPCPPHELVAALRAGVEHCRLQRVERDLLEQTVKGSIQLLVQVLELTAPTTFKTGATTRRIAAHLAEGVGIRETWPIEAAALLAPLGCVTLGDEVVEKGRHLRVSPADQATYRAHAAVGARLLRQVPRLDGVAGLVEAQYGGAATLPEAIVQVAVAAAELYHGGVRRAELPSAVGKRLRSVDRRLLALLETAPLGGDGEIALRLEQLRPGSTLAADVKARSGTLIASAGTEVTYILIERLLRFHERLGIEEPIRVRLV